MFQAIMIDKHEDAYTAKLASVDESQLPEGDVLIDIEYSTLNYKDALAITGAAPVVRSFPMIPGIDFAGTVAESLHPAFEAGDKVLLNGYGVGEQHWGGLAQKARVSSDYLVPIPARLSTKQVMAIGTAGYTAMLCVLAIEDHGVEPNDGEVLVTGATGGVGSIAVLVLSHLGYRIVAVSGKTTEHDYLKYLGATEIIDRAAFSHPGKALQKERWAAVVDVVGSHVLANACAGTKYGGIVTACGLAGGMDLPASVAPFILRGITLKGIDSVMAPMERRIAAWQRLAADLDLEKLDVLSREITLSDSIEAASDLLAGKLKGRLVVDVSQ